MAGSLPASWSALPLAYLRLNNNSLQVGHLLCPKLVFGSEKPSLLSILSSSAGAVLQGTLPNDPTPLGLRQAYIVDLSTNSFRSTSIAPHSCKPCNKLMSTAWGGQLAEHATEHHKGAAHAGKMPAWSAQSMPRLQTLHLEGNQLDGACPSGYRQVTASIIG